MPGAYVVTASSSSTEMIGSQNMGGMTVGSNTSDGYATTYYPGTLNPAEAHPVVVSLMQEASASFSLSPVRLARISGIIRDSQGRPASGLRANLRPSQMLGMMVMSGSASALVASDGSFSISNVPPGDYTLDVRPNGFGRTPPGALDEYASVPVIVSGADVANLGVTTTAGVSARGHVSFEGQPPAPMPGSPLRFIASSAEMGGTMIVIPSMDAGAVDQKGNFEIPNVTGKVVFRAANLPPQWMLKSVTLNGRDVTDTPVDASEEIAGLEIIISDQAARISGVAKNAKAKRLPITASSSFPPIWQRDR